MGSRSAARRAWRVARGFMDPYCDYCGEITREDVPDGDPRRATVEDIKPLSRGGPNNRSNWSLACFECNQKKGDTEVEKPVPVSQPKAKHYQKKTQAQRRERKHRVFHSHRIEEVERLARLARLPFTLYTPIPGVPDEAFR